MRLWVGKIVTAWALAGGGLMLVLVGLTSWNTAGFGLDRLAGLVGFHVSGLSGYEDVVRLVMACAALMCVPYCQHRHGHVAVEVLASRWSEGLQRACRRLWSGCTAVLALFLGWWMGVGLLETWADRTLSPILGWVEWPFYGPGVVSMVLWAWVAAVQSWDRHG